VLSSYLRFPLVFVSTMVTLGACAPVLDSNAWYLSQYKSEYPSLFQPDYKPRQPDPMPDVKALIGANPAAVFGRTQVKNMGVASPRPNGFGWATCVRADVFGITNQGLGTQYFFVEIDGGTVGLRRPANPADKCETDRYELI
jgi:hypothetical protein